LKITGDDAMGGVTITVDGYLAAIRDALEKAGQ